MISYLLRRLLLLPIALFFIVLVNFIIINLAPGDPVTVTEVSAGGEAVRTESGSLSFGADFHYLQFREYFGLTLPTLLNFWPWTSEESTRNQVWQLTHKKYSPEEEKIPFEHYEKIRITLGDQAKFIMPHLLHIAQDFLTPNPERSMAIRFFIRGGTRQAFVGPNLTTEKKKINREIANDNDLLFQLMPSSGSSIQDIDLQVLQLSDWYESRKELLNFEPTNFKKAQMLLFETRLWKYLSRVITLDFGTIRNDTNKTVISEVIKRFKYSLTLSVIPMVITFIICQIFGMIMAIKQNHWQDYSLNLLCLILYAIPIFVVAPFLIEKIALYETFPFTNTPIPFSGFTSSEYLYQLMTTKERLFDILQHICLPLIAIMYGGLAAQSRLARTAILEVLRQDYIRTAYAKGLSTPTIMIKHVGKNAAITIVTSIAGSLGVILGGSLIVETLFDIQGFGKFFYDSIINRDYNVIMFSALSGSFLSLLGYLTADISYTLLDPRVSLD